MPIVAVVGAQWGDEGKGKITDYLASQAQLVARYQGGNNAGHTVKVGGEVFKLHLIPSGMLYPDSACVIGNGVVVDPQVLVDELDYLINRGIDVSRLIVSNKAHVILPYHKELDRLEEEARLEKIGTTGRGIGPCYVDKYSRCGIRMGDFINEKRFEQALARVLPDKNRVLEKIYNQPGFTVAQIIEQYRPILPRLAEITQDTSVVIEQARLEGKNILFEGAQGTLLDVDHGTYPFVTSSNPTAGGAASGLGIGPNRIDKVIGVVKAYTTRVGEGPFPTELHDAVGDKIRERGHEFGTTTGRPRRCGWFDAVMVKYSVRVNGLTGISLMLLDVLDAFDTIKVCIGYRYKGEILTEFPTEEYVLQHCEPVYQTLAGWQQDTTNVREFSDLPQATKDYIGFLAEQVGCAIQLVSVGPGRDQTIVVNSVF